MRLSSGQQVWVVPKNVLETLEPIEYRVLADQNLGDAPVETKVCEVLALSVRRREPEVLPVAELFFDKESARDAAGIRLAFQDVRKADLRRELDRQRGGPTQ